MSFVTAWIVVLIDVVARLGVPAPVTLLSRPCAIPLIPLAPGCPSFDLTLMVPPSRTAVGGAPATKAKAWLEQVATMIGTGTLGLTPRAVVPKVP